MENKIALPGLITLVSANDSVNELVITNAGIYTVNKAQPRAQALLINNGVIEVVGTNQQVLASASKQAKIIDMAGRFLMPGFQDAHVHVPESGFNEILCIFDETNDSLKEYRQQLLDCADDPDNEGMPWLLGSGVYVADLLRGSTQTPLEFLDDLFPELPVLILDNLGHGAWANSQAMQAAGYNVANPVQPQGGIIHLDELGRASGIVFENAQQALRTAAVNDVDPNQEIFYQGLLTGLTALAKNGITSVSDAGGYWTRGEHVVWSKALSNSALTVRASNAYYLFPDGNIDEQIADINALYMNDVNSLLRFNQIKIYIDGILSLGTSALKQPYLFPPIEELDFSNGFEYFKPDALYRYVQAFEKRGFQLHFHATGDRGVHIALNALDNARSQNAIKNPRHRLTHAYLIDPVDRARFSASDIIVDFQLNPSSLDTDFYIPFLKEIIGDRADTIIPVESMLSTGAKVILSSDYDAGPLSPLGTIGRALNRPDNANESVTDVDSAIRMTTLDVAYLLHQENTTGSIEKGKFADLIVLDQDITSIPTNKISQTKVMATLLAGKVVYDQQGLFE